MAAKMNSIVDLCLQPNGEKHPHKVANINRSTPRQNPTYVWLVSVDVRFLWVCSTVHNGKTGEYSGPSSSPNFEMI